jgi:hypothetical protein
MNEALSNELSSCVCGGFENAVDWKHAMDRMDEVTLL